VFNELSDIELLTLCIYGESRGEGLDGMLGVGSVVFNRAKKPCWWGHDIKSVILKDRQFSCFNEDDPNVEGLGTIARSFNASVMFLPVLRRCYWIAKGLLEGYLASNVLDANHYNTTGVDPAWDDKMKLIRTIGKHEFFRQ